MTRLMLFAKSTAIAAVAASLLLAVPARQTAALAADSAVIVAQAGGTEPRELEPRYQPVPPEEKSAYNSSYIFGMTRGLAESTIHPAAKAPLFFFTVPLDLVFFPFAAIGGFFG